MAPRLHDFFRHNGTQRDGIPANMTPEEEEAIIQANLRALFQTMAPANPVATPAPPVSRWSRTSYSVSIYTEDSRFDEDASTLRAPTPVQSVPIASISVTAEDSSKKSCMTPRRLIISTLVFLVLSVLAIVIVLQIHNAGDNMAATSSHNTTASIATNQHHSAEHRSLTNSGRTSSPSTTSTSTSQQHNAVLPSITNSDSTSTASSTAAVVLVATEVVKTTVGTLTTSALTTIATSSSKSMQNTAFSA